MKKLFKKIVSIMLSAVISLSLIPTISMPTIAAYDPTKWYADGNDYIYKGTNTSDTPFAVTTGAELETALDYIGAYVADKPYVIYITGDSTDRTIQMTKRYEIADKNIELRKSGDDDVAILPIAGRAPITDNTAANNLSRHFFITGNESKLVLGSDIVLDGKVTTYESDLRGGIVTEADRFIFNGEIANCRGDSGGAISLKTNGILEIVDGNLHNNFAGTGGAVGPTDWSYTNCTVVVAGHTIIQNNYSISYGGGIALNRNATAAISDTTAVLTVKDNTIIMNNIAGNGAGIYIRSGVISLEGNAEISGNEADITRGYSTDFIAYPGEGGGIFIAGAGQNSPAVLNIKDNVKIINNTAVRGGGGIVAGTKPLGTTNANQIEVNLYGGVISGNKALATARQLAGGYTDFDLYSIGGGGAIYTADRTKINIPSNSTVTFSDNWAPYVTVIESAKLTTAVSGDDYVSHIAAPANVTGNSFTTETAYNHLYNNYDIGIRSAELVANTGVSYSVFDIKYNTGGWLEQIKAFESISGDTVAKIGEKYYLTAIPSNGYIFDGWISAIKTVPELTPAEYAAAFKVSDSANTGDALEITVPNVSVKITPTWTHVAELTGLNDMSFSAKADSPGGNATVPGAQTITLSNAAGNAAATDVELELSGYLKDDFTLTEKVVGTTVNGGESKEWTIQPNVALSANSGTDAVLTLSYNNGVEQVMVTRTVDYGVTASDAAMLVVTQTPTFPPSIEGKAPENGTYKIKNVGTGPATIINVAMANGTVAAGGATTLAVDAETVYTVTPNALNVADTYYNDYDGTITLTYTGGTLGSDPETVVTPVTFRVIKPAQLLVSSNVNLGTANEGYVSVGQRPFQPTNAGYGGVDAVIKSFESEKDETSSAFILSKGLATIESGAIDYSWTVQPKLNLSYGVHEENFTLIYNNGLEDKTVTINVKFQVTANASIKSVTPNGSANAVETTKLTVEFAHPWLGAINHIIPPFAVSGATMGAITGSGAIWDIAITPTAGFFNEGDTVNVTLPLAGVTQYAQIETLSVNGIAVHAKALYTLTVTPQTLDFGTIQQGGTDPAAQFITITNSGNTDATIVSVTSSNTDNFIVAGSGDTVTAGGYIDTWTVQPKSGLPWRNTPYTATITVTYNGGASTDTLTATTTASFTVNKASLDGSVSISGKQEFGETLTAVTTDLLYSTPKISDLGTLSYQWKRVDSSANETIVGTNSPTYKLVSADIGNKIIVTVTAANCVGSQSYTTGTIGKAPASKLTAPNLVMYLEVHDGNKDQDLELDLSSIALSPTNYGAVSYSLASAAQNNGIILSNVTLNGSILKYDYDATLSSAGDTAEQEITISTDNYANITAIIEFIATDKTPVTISGVSFDPKTYDGTRIEWVGSLLVDGGTPTMALTYEYSGTAEDGTTYNASTTPPTNAGHYNLNIDAENTDSIGHLNISFAIDKATLTFTADNMSIVAGDLEPDYTYTMTGLASVDTESTVVDISNLDPHIPTYADSAGTYPIIITGAVLKSGAGDNYVIHYVDGVLTVLAKPVVMISGVSFAAKTYDGLPIAPSSSPIVSGSTATVNFVWLYTGTAADGTTYSASTPPTKAGTYSLKISTHSNDTVSGESEDIPFTIGKAALIITAENKSILVGNSQPDYTYTLTGLAVGDTAAAVIDTEPVLSCPTYANAANNYPIVISGAVLTSGADGAGCNYEIYYVNGTLTVQSVTITFNANGGSVSPSAMQADASGRLASLPTPTISGSYSFGGWFTAVNGGTQVTTATVFSVDTTVYAIWTYIDDGSNNSYYPPSMIIILPPAPAPVTTESSEETTPEIIPPEFPFLDVHESDWFYDDVYYVWAHGLFTGTSLDTFSPGMSTTRGMIVMILYRLAGQPDVENSEPFSDVNANAYNAQAIAWARSHGIVNGIGNNMFDPAAPITRQDLTVILQRYADYEGAKLPVTHEYKHFLDDADSANYAKDAIEAFFKAGIIKGRGNDLFDPTGKATRNEVAAMIHRFIEDTK